MTDTSSLESLRKCMSSFHGTIDASQEILIEWCHANDINADAWATSVFQITPRGQLICDSTTVLIPSLQSVAIQLIPSSYPPAISITPYNGLTKRIIVRAHGEDQFDKLLASLLIWTNLRPAGIPKKWGFKNSIVEDGKSYGNEILICRFKVYGPIPSKVKNLKIVSGPKVPIGNSGSNESEGWFMAMGHLKRNGILDLLLEIDGSLLYSVRIPSLFNSEIRQIDHSIFQNSNILHLGIIQELRSSSLIKPIELQTDESASFIIPSPNRTTTKHDLHMYEQTSRILLEFPLHIDLEDWYVTLSSFTKREYVMDNRIYPNKKLLKSVQKIQLDIVEAKFDDPELYNKKKVYTELILWNSPWFRTSIVETYRDNSFWRESFHFDLPIATESFQIVIKESVNDDDYDYSDPILGTLYINSEMLNPLEPRDIDRLAIYDSRGNTTGKVFLNLHQQHHYILPVEEYRVFEKMIVSIPYAELIEFVKPIAVTLEKLEAYAIILLDIFQTLKRENEWFIALMDHELLPVDHLTRNNRMKGTSPSKTANVFNTLFRGNSMLTKSLEKFNFRVGQEYLEKTIGEFVNKVSTEGLTCEIDPRLIEADDEAGKELKLKQQTLNLLGYVEELCSLIFKTSNDLPAPIKTQLKKFRSKVEHSVEPTDTTTPLNCLTAIIFLRFFCPAILNPKLFYLTKNHQSGDVQRTLTLIAKILLALANRSPFVEHKEPYLMCFNGFIDKNQSEILSYFDKLTGRKLDFQPKILELSDEVTRPSLNIPSEILQELPTNPYLIDKYSRIVELIALLSPRTRHSSNAHENKSILSSGSSSEQMFKIGSLEDEDNMFQEFYDVVNEEDENMKQADNFIKNLLLSTDDLEDLVKTHLKLQDLQNQSQLILRKTKKLLTHFNSLELPILADFDTFIENIFTNTFVDVSSKKIYISSNGANPDSNELRSIAAGGLSVKMSKNSPLRVAGNGLLKSTSMSTLKSSSASTLRGGEGSRNPFKKLFGRKG